MNGLILFPQIEALLFAAAFSENWNRASGAISDQPVFLVFRLRQTKVGATSGATVT